MRYTYDGHADALYIYVNGGTPTTQREVGDITADLDDAGRLVGIEVLTTRLGWNPTHLIEMFGLDHEMAKDLRFLASVPWVEHIQGGTASPAVHSEGSSAPVRTG